MDRVPDRLASLFLVVGRDDFVPIPFIVHVVDRNNFRAVIVIVDRVAAVSVAKLEVLAGINVAFLAVMLESSGLDGGGQRKSR